MASSPDESAGAADEAVRWPLVAKVGVVLAVLTVVGIVVAAVVAAFVVGPKDDDEATVLFDDALDPVAPVAFGSGFLYAERTSGQIVHVQRGGPPTLADDDSFLVSPFAMVGDELATDGQRGLLGLAVRGRPVDDDDVFASWTRSSDGRIVVGDVGTGELIWEGPFSTDFANGGTLAVRGDELLVGIGELQDPDAVTDPARPNGKVLALDPDGPADQTPEVVAGGFHNPFALAVVDDDVWVVDNAPGSQPERIVRIAADGSAEESELDGKRAPSGLAVDAAGDLLLCGFVSEVVERIPVPSTGIEPPAGELDGLPCATGIAVLADGSVVTTTADAIWRN